MKAHQLHSNTASIRKGIETSAEAAYTTITPLAICQLVQWIDRILEWNRKIDLTAARTIDELVDLCLADALALSRTIDTGMRVVDVGSGAGAPGLPLAIIRPDLDVTLVEPLAKRVAFLRTVIGGVGVGAKVLRMRGEDLDSGAFDVAISRATLGPETWLAMGSRLVGRNGKVAVLLARQQAPKQDGISAEEDTDYLWPLTHAARRVQWYRRP